MSEELIEFETPIFVPETLNLDDINAVALRERDVDRPAFCLKKSKTWGSILDIVGNDNVGFSMTDKPKGPALTYDIISRFVNLKKDHAVSLQNNRNLLATVQEITKSNASTQEELKTLRNGKIGLLEPSVSLKAGPSCFRAKVLFNTSVSGVVIGKNEQSQLAFINHLDEVSRHVARERPYRYILIDRPKDQLVVGITKKLNRISSKSKKCLICELELVELSNNTLPTVIISSTDFPTIRMGSVCPFHVDGSQKNTSPINVVEKISIE